MNIHIHCKGIDLLPEEKLYARGIAEKLLTRSKIFEQEESIQVKIDIEKESIQVKDKQFHCSLSMHLPGKTLHEESHSGGVYSSLDSVYILMDKKLHQEKEKRSQEDAEFHKKMKNHTIDE